VEAQGSRNGRTKQPVTIIASGEVKTKAKAVAKKK
jgi:hypothetical protein